VPCNPTNESTLGALSSAKLNTLGATSSIELQGTLGATSSIELQGTLGATSSIELQGTLGATNFDSLCSSSGIGAPNIQGPTFNTQDPAFGT